MKTLIIIILLLLSNLSIAQDKSNKDYWNELLALKRVPDISYQNILSLKLEELKKFGNGFMYHKELQSGDYSIEETDKEIVLTFGLSNKDKESIFRQMKFTKIREEVNGVTYNNLYIKNESNYINYAIAEQYLTAKIPQYGESGMFPLIGYIWKPRIIIDKEICNYGSGYNYGKILNRSVTESHLLTPSGTPGKLFADATDGAIITYPWMNDTKTKIFCADKLWHRIIWFDQDIENPFAQSYGSQGNGTGQFHTPSGLTISGPFNYYIQTGYHYDYPIYVADFSNNRISTFTYHLVPTLHGLYFAEIKPNSFSIIKQCTGPTDIEFHPGIEVGNEYSTQYDDVLWFTQDFLPGRKLTAINAVTGNTLNSITQFKYGSRIYSLEPSRLSVYRSSDGTQNVLACIDNRLHSVIFFKLNADGTMYGGNLPTSFSVYRFNNWDELSSVKLISTNPSLGLQAFVSYNHNFNGHINVFKINLINSIPIADYLASYWIGYNSDISFKRLDNLGNQNGFAELFTLESWDNTYGIRRYKPGLDIISESEGEDYCRNTGLYLSYRLTNPARVHINVYHKVQNEFIKLNEPYLVNGNEFTSTSPFYFPDGTYNFTIKAPNLPLPDNPLIPEQTVKVEILLVPQDEVYYANTYMFTKTYIKSVKNCITTGCPYLYVFEGTEYAQDNNILHRSEFPENVGNDITDKYVLRVPPYFNKDTTDNTCLIKIHETGEDYSYFDNFKLIAIDHPLGSNVGVTENNDVVIYFPADPTSPTYAENNGEDVTDSLQYFNNSIVEGEEGYETFALYSVEDKINQKLKKDVFRVISNAYDGYRKTLKMKKGKGESVPGDTVAIILNPHHPDNGVPIVNKDVAGILNAFDKGSEYSSGDKQFARRQNPSDVIIPLDQDLNIDSLVINWNLDYALTFLAVSPFYYDGYIENELEFVEATKGDENIKLQLMDIDGEYAEMDNSADIILKFGKPEDSVQAGWERDYVLVTTGRYDASVGDGPPESDLVKGKNSIPKEYKLHQNYPNPFNPVTTIMYDIPKDGNVTFKIYDILGKEVYSFDDFRKAGYYRFDFNASHLASGVYFYTIKSNEFYKAKKMLFLK